MPTSKERIDAFIDMYTNKKRMTVRDLKRVQKMLRAYNVGSKEVQMLNVKNLKSNSDYRNAYEIFNHAMENMNAYKSTKEYAKIMSTKYDAMVDDNNQRIYNDAHDPVIIFRANEVLKTVGDTKVVTLDEMRENYEFVAKELSKQGKTVKLLCRSRRTLNIFHCQKQKKMNSMHFMTAFLRMIVRI
jgi:hypothetical protein